MEVVSLINEIYENIDIYRGIIIYDDDSEEKMNQAEVLLKKDDYSFIHLNDEPTMNDDFVKKYRLYLTHINQLKKQQERIDNESITIVFCLSESVYDHARNIFNENKVMIFQI
jgi:predicted N-acyltransferase